MIDTVHMVHLKFVEKINKLSLLKIDFKVP